MHSTDMREDDAAGGLPALSRDEKRWHLLTGLADTATGRMLAHDVMLAWTPSLPGQPSAATDVLRLALCGKDAYRERN